MRVLNKYIITSELQTLTLISTPFDPPKVVAVDFDEDGKLKAWIEHDEAGGFIYTAEISLKTTGDKLSGEYVNLVRNVNENLLFLAYAKITQTRKTIGEQL